MPNYKRIDVNSYDEFIDIQKKLIASGFAWREGRDKVFEYRNVKRVFLGVKIDKGMITKSDNKLTFYENEIEVHTVEEMIAQWFAHVLLH